MPCLRKFPGRWRANCATGRRKSSNRGFDQHRAVGTDGVHLKHILRQIQSDGDNLLLHGTTARRGPTTTTSSHSYAGAEVVYHITSAANRGRGRHPEHNRSIINGILWWLRCGTPWRDVPPKYGNWNTIYRRFRRWTEAGVWYAVSVTLAEKCCPSSGHLAQIGAWISGERASSGG
ncbi:transposase [Novosphingobium guangzhouense]|uniref:transposase n=1 Tax=Novosphingobium guangzhouense TaxID=1850347 RepID=UPI003CCB77D1